MSESSTHRAPLYVERFKSETTVDQPWYFRIKAGNGAVISHSEGYSRKWNRDRAVKRLLRLLPNLREKQEK